MRKKQLFFLYTLSFSGLGANRPLVNRDNDPSCCVQCCMTCGCIEGFCNCCTCFFYMSILGLIAFGIYHFWFFIREHI